MFWNVLSIGITCSVIAALIVRHYSHVDQRTRDQIAKQLAIVAEDFRRNRRLVIEPSEIGQLRQLVFEFGDTGLYRPYLVKLLIELKSQNRIVLDQLNDLWRTSYEYYLQQAFTEPSPSNLQLVRSLRDWEVPMITLGCPALPSLPPNWNQLVAKTLIHPEASDFDHPPSDGLEWLAARAVRTSDLALAKMVYARCRQLGGVGRHGVPDPLLSDLIKLIEAHNADLHLVEA